LLALPPLAIAVALCVLLPFLRTFVPERAVQREAAGENRPGALTVLLAVIGFRSLAWWGLLTFVPLWEVSLGHSKSYGNHLLSLMLLVGGIGTIVVGPAADRIGRRPVLVASLVAAGPLILVFVAVGGVVGAVALALVGVFTVGTFGLTMVMSQEYLPRQIGMASGLSIGFSIGLGGVAALGLGALADAVDLRTALYVCAAAPVAGLALTLLLLPSTRTRRQLEPEIAVP
jgi:FSR family fosmidomycin resistance protein-like MFS transporter